MTTHTTAPFPIALPLPDADGIYTFADDLARTHADHQALLDAAACDGDTTLVDVTAPYSGAHYRVARRPGTGRPLIVLEPHHDDLVLSAAGTLLTQDRPLVVITVFTKSASAHGTVQATYPGEQEISALRGAEAHQSLLPFTHHHIQLGHTDARPPYRAYDPALLDTVTNALEREIAMAGDGELIAPAAVTRHPDHLLVHEAARRLGCTRFWDDTAFWTTYGLGVDDRHLFRLRTRNTMAEELFDITDVVLDKLTLLHLHGSQLQPARAMYRPIRYAWTTAAPLHAETGDPARFAERFYRLETS